MTRGARGVWLAACLGAASAGAVCADEAVERALIQLERTDAALREQTLGNGLRVLVKPDRAAPVAAVQIWVGSGAIHEGPRLGSGLCHAIEHMIFKGTGTRGPGDITRAIHDAGGTLNAYTGFDRTVFHADVPSERWRTALEVLTDAVLHAAFPADEWEREREVIRREIAMGRDDPERVLGKLLWRTAFRRHPYRFPVIGHEDLFLQLSREDLAAYARAHYVPDNMTVVVVGDVPADAVVEAVRALYDAEPRGPRPATVLPAESPQAAPYAARETGPYNISRVAVAWHTVVLSHPDAPALDILAEIAGHGRTARLVKELKEERRLVHSIEAWSYTPKEPGLFGITAAFEPGREGDVVAALDEAVGGWLETGFNAEEIATARRKVLTAELGRLETMHGQASRYAAGAFYAGDPCYLRRYLRLLDAVTPEVLRDVAQRYLRPANRTRVVLAPEQPPDATAAAAAPAETVPGPVRVRVHGVPVIVREDHRLPFAHLCAVMGGGVLSETAEECGISRLAAELLVRGSERRTAEAVAAAVESRGGSLAPFSGYNSFGLQARCLSGDLGVFLDVLCDCLFHPSFPADEFEKQRAFQLAAIAEREEQPMELARANLRRLLFGGHPYAGHPLGTADSVAALTRTAVAGHAAALAGRGNLVLAVFGDVTPEAVEAAASPFLRDAPRGRFALPPPPDAWPAEPVRSVRREPRQQAVVTMGFPGVAVDDARSEALDVLRTALSGLSSELALDVRDRRGLAYYVGAYNRTGWQPGTFVLYAGTRADAVGSVESLMLNEVGRLTAGGLEAAEFERARQRRIGAYRMDLQDNAGLALRCALHELYGLGYEYVYATESRLDALTPEAVRAAARSVLTTNGMAVSVVLPLGAPGGTEREGEYDE
ncbi:MAG: insulinase family protein [Lentisphaerae bacterium]|nr:insulinase family protein [Lentisphaerota bacterium]